MGVQSEARGSGVPSLEVSRYGRHCLLRSLALQIIVVSGSALASLIPMCLVPALPAMAAALGGGANNAFYAQMVMTAPAISCAIAAPLAAFVAPHIGLRSGLIASLLLYLVSGIFPLVADNLVLVVVSRVLLGLAGGSIGTLTTIIVGEFVPEVRNRLLGLTHAMGGGAAITALALGGILVDTAGWRGPFVIYLAALPILCLSIYAVRDNPPLGRARASQGRMPVSALWVLYLILFIMSVGFFTPGVEGPFLLTARGILSARSHGLFLSAMPLVSVFVSAGYGWFARVLSERALVFATFATLGVGLVLTGGFVSAPVILSGFAITGVGAGLAVPIVMSILIGRTSNEVRLYAIGIYFTVMFLGQFLTPALIEPISVRSGSDGVFLWTGVVMSAAAFLAVPAVRSPAEV